MVGLPAPPAVWKDLVARLFDVIVFATFWGRRPLQSHRKAILLQAGPLEQLDIRVLEPRGGIRFDGPSGSSGTTLIAA